jgi:hypothetical protein
MKLFVVLFGLLAWIGCSEESDLKLSADVIETDAQWANYLAADGCDWHFVVAKQDTTYYFVPDNKSLSKIESALGKPEGFYGFTNVHVKYTKTGNKKEVLCGWNQRVNYDEVSIVSITKL